MASKARGGGVGGLHKAASALSLGGASDATGEETPRSLGDASTMTGGSGLSMKEKAALKKAARREAAAGSKEGKGAGKEGEEETIADAAKALREGSALPAMTKVQELNAAARRATGVLASEKRARDVKIISFSLSLHSSILVEDTTIELNWGQRYGLIGRNGCGACRGRRPGAKAARLGCSGGGWGSCTGWSTSLSELSHLPPHAHAQPFASCPPSTPLQASLPSCSAWPRVRCPFRGTLTRTC